MSPTFLLRWHEICGGCEKIVLVSETGNIFPLFIQLNYSCFLFTIFPPIASLQFRHINPHTTNNSSNRFDEGLTLETSAFSLLTVATHYDLLFGVGTENEGHCETGISRNSFCADLALLFHIILFLVRKFYGHYLNGSPSTRTGATRQTRIPDLKKTMTNLERQWNSENREINFILWSVWLAVLFAYGVRFETSTKKTSFLMKYSVTRWPR